MSSSPIRLFLIGDHALFREILGVSLQKIPRFFVAGSFASLEEILQVHAEEHLVDVLLVSGDIRQGSLASTLRSLPVYLSYARVLLIADSVTDVEIAEAIRNGATGIFPKKDCLLSLCSAIECVAHGQSWLPAGAKFTPLDLLTDRTDALHLGPIERGVLQDICDGLSNKEIGEHLFMSESNVKAYVQKLFRKTGVRARSQLVRIALQRSHELGVRL